MTPYRFKLEFEVRDYECDLEGIVNNAVYQNYLEHARHTFLKQQGIDFAALTQQGIYMVVIRTEVDYLASLRSGDRFWVGINLERTSRLRVCFLQDIYRLPKEEPIVKAKVFGTALNAKGRPSLPKELEMLFVSSLNDS